MIFSDMEALKNLTDEQLIDALAESVAAEAAAKTAANVLKVEAKARWDVGGKYTANGHTVTLTEVERRLYRVREVLGVQRALKLNPSDIFTVKAAGIKKLPADVQATLPFTADATVRITVK